MHVDIVPVGDVPATVKREASDGLRSVYDCEVSMHEPRSIPAGAHDESWTSTGPRSSSTWHSE